MISSDKGIVTIECDSPGCCRSMTRQVSRGINALDEVLRKVSQQGWMVADTGIAILHLCGGCGAAEPAAIPLYSHIKPDGKVISRGSHDLTGLLDGIVVAAQDLAKGQRVALEENGKAMPVQIKPLSIEQARKARKARRRVALGLCNVSDDMRQELSDKLEKARDAFKLTINLEDSDAEE